MGDENHICTLGDYSKPSHKGYRNTIEIPVGNNVVPLRSDTIRLVQNGCSFHRLWSEDLNQHLKDFLKLVDSLDLDGDNKERTRLHLFQFSFGDQASNWLERLLAGSITTWEDLTTRFLAQLFPPGRTAKLCNDILIPLAPKDLALYDNKSWNDPRDFAKSIKAIALPQDVPNARLSKFKADFKRQQGETTNKIDTVLKAITDQIASTLPSDTVKNPKLGTHPVLSARSYPTIDPQCSTQIHSSINAIIIHPKQQSNSHDRTEENEEEERGILENHTGSPTPPDPSISFIIKKVLKFNSLFESLGLVPPSPNAELVCIKKEDGDVMFIEIILKDDNSHKEELEAGVQKVEYFDIFLTRSELAYHKYLMCGPIPSIFLQKPINIEGCQLNLKIPCNIRHVHVEKAYIDFNPSLNIMT
ncbi:MAK10-like protein [Tanacetum coccineum]